MIDTNIFDHHLDVLSVFVDDIEKHKLPITIIIPKIVRQELDWYVILYVMMVLAVPCTSSARQTHRREKDDLTRAASRATRWLASSNKPSWLIREQTEGETLKPAGSASNFEPSKAGEVRTLYCLCLQL